MNSENQGLDLYSNIQEHIAISDKEIFVDGETAPIFSGANETELERWLSSYIYYRFYANDNDALRYLTSPSKRTGTLRTLEDESIAKMTVEGCDHKYFRDKTWHLLQTDKVFNSGKSYYVVSNGIVHAYCLAEQCIIDSSGIVVLANPVQRFLMPGWTHIIGEHGGSRIPHSSIVRYYHSLKQNDDITEIVRSITKRLNEETIWYRLKIANNSAGLLRNDAIVVYSPDTFCEALLAKLSEPFSLPSEAYSTPPMTKRMMTGWALAPECYCSSGRSSYGQECCRILAQALVETKQLRKTDTQAAIRRLFAERGRNPEKPYERLA